MIVRGLPLPLYLFTLKPYAFTSLTLCPCGYTLTPLQSSLDAFKALQWGMPFCLLAFALKGYALAVISLRLYFAPFNALACLCKPFCFFLEKPCKIKGGRGPKIDLDCFIIPIRQIFLFSPKDPKKQGGTPPKTKPAFL